MVRAIENESLFDFREAADALMLGVSEVNRAQLARPHRRIATRMKGAWALWR